MIFKIGVPCTYIAQNLYIQCAHLTCISSIPYPTFSFLRRTFLFLHHGRRLLLGEQVESSTLV